MRKQRMVQNLEKLKNITPDHAVCEICMHLALRLGSYNALTLDKIYYED